MVADLSGSASIHHDRNGTACWRVVGQFAVTFHPGNPCHRPGEFVLGGLTELVLHPEVG